jgi:long-chain acyl-CoA synthetase
MPPVANIFDRFAATAGKFADHIAVETVLRTGAVTHTYSDLRRLADEVASLLITLGAGRGTRCALVADNDARWCGTYLGILRIGGVAVPLDTSYRPGQVRTLVEDSGATVAFTTLRHLPTVQEAVEGLPSPPRVVLMSGSAPGTTSFDEAAGPGRTTPLPACPAVRTDPAVILYTSGTTSDPKGVVLTHGNWLAEMEATLQVVAVTERDGVLAILPLFHALAQLANLLLPLTVGARVVFLETLTSADMMRAFVERKITAFCVVPQFYYLLHQRVMERVRDSPFVVRASFSAMLRVNGWLRRFLGINLGRVMFRQVHAALGNRMRLLVAGGSRFDPRIGRDLYRMGFNILQAYGLTECSGAATVLRQGDSHIESVGEPLPGVEVRIAEEPGEAGDRDRQDGEVLIKGPIVMAGYHNRPDANAVTLMDGWLYSGDLGFLDARGRLHITGRRKDVIVLASGKNIYPEEIEDYYLESPVIKEICVMGISRPDEPSAERLHAIVVPNLEVLRERRVVNTRELIRFNIEGVSIHLPHHKRVLSFDIWLEDLPRTTTRKLKRHVIERMYRERMAESVKTEDAGTAAEADELWAADPHVERVLAVVRAAVRPGAVLLPDTSIELDLGLDSMERVELLTSLEHAFNIEVPEATSQTIYTLRDLADAVRPRTAEAAAAAPVQIDPWARLLADDPDDEDLGFLLKPKPVVSPIAFLVMKAVFFVARVLLRLRVSGRQMVPVEGAFLVSPNHQSFLDVFLLVSTLRFRTFRRMFFVGASEYFRSPFKQWFARLMNVVPVDPDTNLVRAMRAGAYGLRHGKVLILFPEGERSPDGAVRKFKKGAAILAHQLDVPIVPVAIHGAFEVWPRGKPFRWGALLPWWPGARPAIRFGLPLSPQNLPAAPGSDRYAMLTERLRASVQQMWDALNVGRLNDAGANID